jgi:formyl-CoA transferase
VADLITAIITTSGILAALVGRDRSTTKEGGLVQTSLLEAMSSITIDSMTQMFETGASPTRQTRHPQAQNFCLLTASGDSITLHLSSSEKFWRALAIAMDRKDLLEDSRFARFPSRQDNFWELKPIVEEEFKKRTREEWEERLTAADVPFAPVLTMREVADHPQTQWLELIEPENSGNTLVRPPWRFDGKRPTRSSLAPRIGEHTTEIAAEVLGESKVRKLIAEGVIVQAANLEQPAGTSVRATG